MVVACAACFQSGRRLTLPSTCSVAVRQRCRGSPDGCVGQTFDCPATGRTAREAFIQAWVLAERQRVEIACSGGYGRTGTAMACIAILDGVPAREAVAFVRAHYNARAVETPGQRRFVAAFCTS